MGHIRLGRLPKTLAWRDVIGLLDTEPDDAASIASATVRAADARLRKLANDPSLAYSVWLLVRVMTAARSDNFHAELNRLGIPVSGETSSLGLVAQIGDRARDELAQFDTSGHAREIAAQSLRQTLHDTVLQTGADMFMASSEDAQRALRSYSTQARFGELLRRYFATFMSRTLRSVVERELTNHVGRGHAMANASESVEFLQQLDRHVWQVSRIVEDFSGGWYSKLNWETGGEITQAETQGFVAHAPRYPEQESLPSVSRVSGLGPRDR